MSTPSQLDTMNPGFFWIRAGGLQGVTEDEGYKFTTGQLEPTRAAQISALVEQARQDLDAAPVPGFQDWMEGTRRARS